MSRADNTAVSSDDSDDDIYNFAHRFHELKQLKRKVVFLDESKLSEDKKNDNTIELTNDTEQEQSLVDLTSSDNVVILNDSNSGACAPEVLVTNNRTRRRRNNPLSSNANVVGPVITIGDFYDGYDMPLPIVKPVVSDDEKLKQTIIEKKEEEEFLIAELNREINVKVHWCKMRVHRFLLRRFQSIESIYEHFAKLENIKTSEVLLRFKNKRLSPSDTLASIGYKFAEFIDGDIEYYRSIFDKSATEEELADDNEVKFKIKQQDVRHPLLVSIKKTDKMAVLYIKLSETLGMDINSFTIEFDGDIIGKCETIESLDLDGDECFELFEKKTLTTVMVKN